jgi:hypothetical protein
MPLQPFLYPQNDGDPSAVTSRVPHFWLMLPEVGILTLTIERVRVLRSESPLMIHLSVFETIGFERIETRLSLQIWPRFSVVCEPADLALRFWFLQLLWFYLPYNPVSARIPERYQSQPCSCIVHRFLPGRPVS